MSAELLRTGDKALVRFRWIYHVEYMKTGWTLLFREGRTKGIGKITKLIPLRETEGGTEPCPTLKKKMVTASHATGSSPGVGASKKTSPSH